MKMLPNLTAAIVSAEPIKALVILGHPRPDSFCAAISGHAAGSLGGAGIIVQTLSISEIEFNQDVLFPSPRAQPLEPRLEQARQLIQWADHLVIVYPVWWGMMPARLKGFLDRVLLPGWAFREDRGSWRPLLMGRSAHLYLTMDTPGWVYRWIYRAPSERALGTATLGFCGVRPIRVTRFCRVKDSSDAQRQAWLEQVERECAAVPRWLTRHRRRRRLFAWLRIVRPQFYAMTALAYGVGAFGAAVQMGTALHFPALALGFLCMFLLELATVLTNELHDFETDRRNENAGPFNGGSRMLVEGRLSLHDARRATTAALMAAVVAGAALIAVAPPGASPALIAASLAIGAMLGLGYTAPPLKLAYRSLGELNVAFTHSFFMVLCGWMFQGGGIAAVFPWAVSVPMFLAVMAAIILAGFPDAEADRAVEKKTFVVRWGIGPAVLTAAAAVALAAASALVLRRFQPWFSAEPLSLALMLSHAGVLSWLLARLLRSRHSARIDLVLFAALSFILWFCVPLLLHLAGASRLP